MANLSPHVSFTERDYTQIVPTVTSAVGGMVIHAEKGPVNVRVTLTNPKDLESVYGRPNDVTFTHWFTAETFLKQSNNLQVVRVEDSGRKVAGLTIGTVSTLAGDVVTSVATTKATSSFPLDYADILENEALDITGGNVLTEEAYHFYGVGPGKFYERIAVTVVNKNDFDQLIALKGELAEASDTETVNEIAEKYYNGVAATTAAPAQDYLSNSLTKYDIFTPPATGGTDWYIDRSYLFNITAFENGPDADDEAVLIVWDEFGEPSESYLFSNDYEKKDPLGNFMFGPKLVNANSKNIYFFIGDTEVGAAGVSLISTRKTFLGGADEITGIKTGTSLADLTGEIMTAWQDHFTNPEDLEVDLLLDPDYPDAVKRYMDQIAKEIRKDCFCVLSMPLQYMLNPTNKRPIAAPYTAMKDYVRSTLLINSSYSAIYGNYFKIYDRFAEKERWVPASGFAAATIAYTDFTDAQWFAPAGINRGIISNVIDIAVNPNKGQRDVLYYDKINPIVKFQGEGIVIWGQKTLTSKASAFDRINVRRLFLHLEKSIVKMARAYLFEFNDDFTRTSFRGTVNPFMSGVKARRGVYDYLVVCDETNNPPEVIDRNEFRAEILVKPTRVAEFINLTFTAVGTGTEFSEVVQKLA
jgi:phage tail sheath protein FI